MSLQAVRDATFRSRLFLAPPWACAVTQAMGWPGLASASDMFTTKRDALYKLESLRPTAGFAADWKALLNPLLYANVLLSFTASLPHLFSDISAICTWYAPMVASSRRDIESLFEAKLQISLVTLAEEKYLAAYNVACSLMQMVVVLSNRLSEEGDAILKLCIKLMMAAESALANLHSARTREQATLGQVVVVATTNPGGGGGGGNKPMEEQLSYAIPLSAPALAVLLAWARAQLAELWLGCYTIKWQQTEVPSDLDKVIGAAYLASGYYREVYERIQESVGNNDEARADLLEAFSAGPEPLGRMRRVAAVKRHYALALAASYVTERGPVHHRATARAIMESSLTEARKSLHKRSNVLFSTQRDELQRGIDELQDLFNSLDLQASELTQSEAGVGLTLTDLFAKLPHLPGLGGKHSATALAIEPTELLTGIMQQAKAVVQSALRDNVRTSTTDDLFDLDLRTKELASSLMVASDSPRTNHNNQPSRPSSIPNVITNLFQDRQKLFVILKRLGVLAIRAREIGAYFTKSGKQTPEPTEQRAHQLLTEQLTALVALVGRVVVPKSVEMQSATLLALALTLAYSDWPAVAPFHQLIPTLSSDLQLHAYFQTIESAQASIREDTKIIMEHFRIESQPIVPRPGNSSSPI